MQRADAPQAQTEGVNSSVNEAAAQSENPAVRQFAEVAASDSLTGKTIGLFTPNAENRENRAAFEQAYGVTLPDTATATRRMLREIAAQQKAKSEAVPVVQSAELPSEAASVPQTVQDAPAETADVVPETAAPDNVREVPTAAVKTDSYENAPLRETLGLRPEAPKTQREAEVQRALEGWRVTDKAAETISKNMPDRVDADRYAAAASPLYRLGRSGAATFAQALELAGSMSGTAADINYILSTDAGRTALEIAYTQGKGERMLYAEKMTELGGALGSESTSGRGEVYAKGTMRQESDPASQIISLNAAATGTDAVLRDVLQNDRSIRAYVDTETARIFFGDSAQDIFGTVLHEDYHWYNALDAEGARTLQEHALEYLAKSSGYESLDEMIRAKLRDYSAQSLTYEQAAEELVADAWRGIFDSEESFKRWVTFQRGQAEKNAGKSGAIHKVMEQVRQMLDGLISRAKEVLTIDPDNRAALKAKRLAEAEKRTLQEEYFAHAEKAMDNLRSVKENAAALKTESAAEGRGVRYSINPSYAQDIDEWNRDGRNSREIFVLGSTAEALQGLGARENDIYMKGDKISLILEQHPEMTLNEIKRIPEILDDPILVLSSRNKGRAGSQNTRLVLFGSVKAQDGRPVLCVLDLQPVENRIVIQDMQKATSAYTKDNDPVRFVRNSEVLYTSENKKRTTALLRTLGFQMPSELQRYGSMGSISYHGQNVKMEGVPFTEIEASGGTHVESEDSRSRLPKGSIYQESSLTTVLKTEQGDEAPKLLSKNSIAQENAESKGNSVPVKKTTRFQLAEQADREAKQNQQRQASRVLAEKAAAFDTLNQFFGLTKNTRLSDAALESLAIRWTKTNGSRADRAKLANETRALVEYLRSEGADMAKAQGLAETLAGEVLDEATYRNTELWNQYPDLHDLTYTVDKNGKAKAELVKRYGSWTEAVAEARRHGVKLRQAEGYRDGNPAEQYEAIVNDTRAVGGVKESAAALFRSAAQEAGVAGAASMESTEWLDVLMNVHDTIKPRMMSRFADAAEYEDAKVELAGRMIGDIMSHPEMTDAEAVFEGILKHNREVAAMAAGSEERAAEVTKGLKSVQQTQRKAFADRMRANKREQAVQAYAEATGETDETVLKTVGGMNERLTFLREEYERRLKAENQRLKLERQRMEDFFGRYTTNLINETSMKLLGYDRATVKNYYPIAVDRSTLATEIEGVKMDATIEGRGFLKERVKSDKPILLEECQNVVKRSLRDTAAYAGLAAPIRDVQRVLNSTVETAEGIGVLKDKIIGEKWGKETVSYINDLLTDLQTTRRKRSSTMSRALDRMRGNYAGAILTVNPGVAIAQAASLPTAGAVLGADTMAAVLPFVKNFSGKQRAAVEAEIRQHGDALLQYRLRGTKRGEMSSIGAHKNLVAKALEAMPAVTGWITGMDEITVAALWEGSKRYVERHAAEFGEGAAEKGSEAYWEAVNKMYQRVIEETQPNYTTMQRAGIQRSDNEFVKTLTMFTTQRFQNYGILADAVGDYKAQKARYAADQSAENKAEVQRAGQSLRRAAASQVVQTAVFALMKIGADFLLHRWDKEQDENGDITAASVGKRFFDLYTESAAGNFLYGSEIYSALTNARDGKDYDVVSATNISAVNDLFAAFTKTVKLLRTDTGEMSEEELTAHHQKLNKAVLKDIQCGLELYGVPAANIRKVMQAFEGYWEDAQAIGRGEGFSFNSAPSSATGQYDRLYNAIQSGDSEEAAAAMKKLEQMNKTDKVDGELARRLKQYDADVLAAAEARNAGKTRAEEKARKAVFEKLREGLDVAPVTDRAKGKADAARRAQLIDLVNKAVDGKADELLAGGKDGSIYDALLDEVKNGRVEDAQTEINRLLTAGKKKSSIKDKITEAVKEEYLAGSDRDREKLEKKLLALEDADENPLYEEKNFAQWVSDAVSNRLNGLSTSRADVVVQSGKAYTAALTLNEGYWLISIKVTMGGEDVTATAWNEKKMTVSIPDVTGNIVITAEAKLPMLKELAVGAVTKLVEKDGAAAEEFMVIAQDYEKELNGEGRTLLARRHGITGKKWNTTWCTYADSLIDVYLNSEYLKDAPQALKDILTETKFYYTPGYSGSGSSYTGSHTVTTLSRKVFLPSCYEFGFESYGYTSASSPKYYHLEGSTFADAKKLALALLAADAETAGSVPNTYFHFCLWTRTPVLNDYGSGLTGSALKEYLYKCAEAVWAQMLTAPDKLNWGGYKVNEPENMSWPDLYRCWTHPCFTLPGNTVIDAKGNIVEVREE